MNPNIRILRPGDEARLSAFLEANADAAMFLRANLQLGGLLDRGKPHQCTYAALLDAEERVRSVVAAAWNGNLLFLAPEEETALAREALRNTARPIRGLVGPWSQISVARGRLGLMAAPVGMNSHEDLLALQLSELRVPEALENGSVTCGPATLDEVEVQTQMRCDFRVHGIKERPYEGMSEHARAEVLRWIDEGALFSLRDASGKVVSTAVYSVRLADSVQIGGVWTPPEERQKGYARAVVAGALLHARAQGIPRAVLFTGRINAPAQAAYKALGFERVGEYGLIFFG